MDNYSIRPDLVEKKHVMLRKMQASFGFVWK